MATTNERSNVITRRNILGSSAVLLGAGLVGSISNAVGHAADAASPAPPLPWKWVKLDPLEAGRRAYRYYLQNGCGTASYLSILSLLKEKVGYPWTTLPDMMMAHAAAGYAGHGTLCGALGGASCIINLVAYSDKDEIFRQMIDRLFYWYAEQEFPTDRFDDISAMPKQVKAKAMTPLCHTSVSTWTLTAGVAVTSKAKKERCAKVAGEVVYVTVDGLNEYFAGRWTPPVWKPSKETAHCVECHGPDNMQQSLEGMNHQQGHMECLLCHQDHTK